MRDVTGPQNPVCPECGEAVGATSTYCMHCEADFDAPVEESAFAGSDGTETTDSGNWSTADANTTDDDGDWGGSDQDAIDDDGNWGGDDQDAVDDGGDWGESDQSVTEHQSGWAEGGPGDEGHTQGWAEADDATTDPTADHGTAGDASADATSNGSVDTTSDATPDAISDYGTTGDDSAGGGEGSTGRTLVQSAARIGAVLLTVVVGAITTFALIILTGDVAVVWIPVALVGLVGIVTGGIVIARQDSGVDALADALYVTAAVLVGLPFVFMLLLPTNDPLLEKAVGGLIFSFFGAFIGVPAFIVGYVLQPDDE